MAVSGVPGPRNQAAASSSLVQSTHTTPTLAFEQIFFLVACFHSFLKSQIIKLQVFLSLWKNGRTSKRSFDWKLPLSH